MKGKNIKSSMSRPPAAEAVQPPSLTIPALLLEIPRWGAPCRWRAACRRIGVLLHCKAQHLPHVQQQVRAIEQHLRSLDVLFKHLGPQTCRMCPDPCCQVAKIYFDFRDLVFIMLHSQQLPPNQPLPALTESCQYLGPKGCRLSRDMRPWVCTWYLCPVQKSFLRSGASGLLDTYTAAAQAVTRLRKQLARDIIQSLAPDSI